MVDSRSPISSTADLQQQPVDEDDEHRARHTLSKQLNALAEYFVQGID